MITFHESNVTGLRLELVTPVYDIKNLPSTLLHYWTPAGARTHGPSTTDKKSSALPTPLLGPAYRFSWLYPSDKRVDIVL